VKRLLSPVPIAVLVVVAALLALLAYGVAQNEPDRSIEEAVAAGESEPAPDFRLPLLKGGGERSLRDFRGRVVVLNYWASWCEPCRAESPLLERFHQRIAGSGGTVLGVDVLDVDSDAREFIREYGLTYPMLRDASGASQKEFGVVAYPETFVIDRRGRVVAAERGPVDEAFLRREVLPLLEEPA
jgi:cytochrome c biogenesis protein CcmG/thiol:disulfide interchange protein DsbE